MNLNLIRLLNFNINTKFRSTNKTAKNQQVKIGSDFNVNYYPKNYYLNQISFGLKSRISANDLIVKIGEKNFPSKKIVEELKSIGNSKDFSLYNIHLNHYKDLQNCLTLAEAKQKYPEFENVLDAKNIYQSSHKSSAIYKIGSQMITDVNIENLSLELLKKYYGKAISLKKQDEYYNITQPTLYALFNSLNIKRMDTTYFNYTIKSSDKFKTIKSKQLKNRWGNTVKEDS